MTHIAENRDLGKAPPPSNSDQEILVTMCRTLLSLLPLSAG